MSMADRVVLLRDGQVEQNAPPEEIYQRPATSFAARFIGTPPMNILGVDLRGRPGDPGGPGFAPGDCRGRGPAQPGPAPGRHPPGRSGRHRRRGPGYRVPRRRFDPGLRGGRTADRGARGGAGHHGTGRPGSAAVVVPEPCTCSIQPAADAATSSSKKKRSGPSRVHSRKPGRRAVRPVARHRERENENAKTDQIRRPGFGCWARPGPGQGCRRRGSTAVLLSRGGRRQGRPDHRRADRGVCRQDPWRW